ncbi:hypothetical protein AMATHDRAFT_49004 [Amanita thiersii Skay4041]|uniref:Uncharacterized protein n=1 Tax=Amanita thiersii Skay4041 TaxID=703135 RepID=A0A2A9NMX6_9AGAR|nr:hypothetical protein AMATHDRAFT_49004 [Amanita thiersii Skay4041]
MERTFCPIGTYIKSRRRKNSTFNDCPFGLGVCKRITTTDALCLAEHTAIRTHRESFTGSTLLWPSHRHETKEALARDQTMKASVSERSGRLIAIGADYSIHNT